MKHPRTCPPAGTMTVAIVLVVLAEGTVFKATFLTAWSSMTL